MQLTALHPLRLASIAVPLAMVLSLSVHDFASGASPDAKVTRVLVWDEQQPEQKQAYGEKFLGETIAAHLSAKPAMAVKSTSLAAPEQGLDEAIIDATDVVIWWSHKKNPEVLDANAERIASRV